MIRNSRTGSALLIVLGMLSFMVISAIGFSVFMRQNRLPSSYVRRNTTANQLLKAGLARAMNDLDSAIGDHAFPGRGEDSNANKISPNLLKGINKSRYIGDVWKGRVFLGAMKTSSADINVADTNNDNLLVPYEDTVSTLTMEGVAYLPPCLVNDVRYFSRHTPTAKWQRLGYDAGRFAYTAVNVSDYFDVNKIEADSARDFSPSNRVSLAYLFASDKGDLKDKSLEDFQNLVNKATEPYVSLADMSLVLHQKYSNNDDIYSNLTFVSPFAQYALGLGEPLNYYGDYSFGAKTNAIAKTTFVTNSYFPEPQGKDDDLLDLNEEKNQPFEGNFSNKPPQLAALQKNLEKCHFGTEINNLMKGQLSVGLAANLYDYLDGDSVPVSLALPSVEEVPMIAGVKIHNLNGVKAKITRKVEGVDPTQNPMGPEGPLDVVAKYYLDFEGVENLSVDVDTFFPFPNAEKAPSQYSLAVAAQIVWAVDGLNHQNPSNDMSAQDLVVQGLLTSNQKSTEEGMDALNRYVFKEGSGSIKNSIPTGANPDSAFAKTQVSLDKSAKAASVPIAIITEHWSCTIKEKIAKWTFLGSDMTNGDEAKGPIDSAHRATTAAGNYIPYLALRVAVRDGDKTLDLVPASVWDDENNSGGKPDDESGHFAYGYRSAILVKAEGTALSYSTDSLQALTGLAQFGANANPPKLEYKFSEKSLACRDPRWNHNLANWDSDASDVVSKIKSEFNGADTKDSDFFLSVSNSEWLNSISELSFLPRTKAFIKDDRTLSGLVSTTGASDSANFAKSLPLMKEIAEKRGEAFWLCDSEMGDEKSLESLFTDATGGIRVNPYSDDPNIFLAAVAYSPKNWTFATPSGDDSKEEFDEENTLLDITEAKEISEIMQRGFAKSSGGDWVEAFNKLGWGFGTGNDIFSDTDLTSVDKKFLFGFWKGCFDVRQQLFIIFVRAEPTVSGGGAVTSGRGARAVAVVWRNPNPPESDVEKDPANEITKPHEMRVLFYKTLE